MTIGNDGYVVCYSGGTNGGGAVQINHSVTLFACQSRDGYSDDDFNCVPVKKGDVLSFSGYGYSHWCAVYYIPYRR